jgi:glycosyltransferase involved in cell wall biosynthesis
MNKIHVLYFVPNFGTGGTERLVYDLCTHLDPLRFEVSVCSFFPGIYSKELARQGKRHHVITDRNTDERVRNSIFGKVSGYLSRLKRIKRIIETEEIDVINTHHLGPFIHVILLRPFLSRKVGLVHTEHNPPDTSIYNKNQVKICLPLLKYADAVTGVSRKVADYIRETCHLPSRKVHAILNGVNTEAFRTADSRERMRGAMGFARSDAVIGMIGNLRAEKNQRVLITAFSLLYGAMPHLYLVLAGDGSCRRDLEQLARELAVADRVHFLGHRLDAPDVMAMFDVYCLPSVYEGMPLSILEAWSAGKPVVATDVTGIRDIVIHDTNGLLVPVNDAQSLASALQRVLGDSELSERLSHEGQKYALERCTMAGMVRQYEDLYEQVARDVKRPRTTG